MEEPHSFSMDFSNELLLVATKFKCTHLNGKTIAMFGFRAQTELENGRQTRKENKDKIGGGNVYTKISLVTTFQEGLSEGR